VDDASAIVGAFHLVVSTSWHEGTPLALLEAQAAGVPIVATAVGGVPEIVANGEDGLLVPPGDVRAVESAIRRLHRAARSQAARRAGGDLRLRSFASFVDETAAVLEQVATRATRAPPFRSYRAR
jgi:glycosyltransferase involved in cell wall biosynthesis